MKHAGGTGVKRGSAAPRLADGQGGAAARIRVSARSLFAAKGYEATSVREIATEAGVTVPGLYYHFASKADILRVLVEGHAERRLSKVLEALEGTSAAAPPESLAAALTAYGRFLVEEGETAAIVLGDPQLRRDPALTGRVAEAEERIAGALTTVIERGVAEGRLVASESERTARLLLGALRSVGLDATLGVAPVSSAAGLEILVRLLLRGIRADPARSSLGA